MDRRQLSQRGPAACVVVAFVVGLLPCQTARAMYVRPDIEQVPVERLVKNLQKQMADNPTDVKVKVNLARLHAMAFALKTDTATVWRGRENQGVWFGHGPKNVPFAAKPTTDSKQEAAAKEHLKQAVALYQKAVEQAPDDPQILLGHAWCVDQSGDQKKAVELYRTVIDKAWAREKDMRRAGLGWHSIVAETTDYLVPLLDKDKDATEIKDLQARSEKLQRLPRPVTPIIIPLGDGLRLADLVDRSARVPFDADGSGEKKTWTWITPKAGWLVYDPQGTGHVDSALQMFGGVSFWLFWANGYEALRALDDNGDGVLRGPELAGLAVWCDANGNGRVDPGEVQPLSYWGITEISCRYMPGSRKAGTAAESPQGVRLRNGATRPTYDVILEPRQ
jgi:hypothetical protein